VPKRPSHPAPNVRDDRETPLLWGRDAVMISHFSEKAEDKYFFGKALTSILKKRSDLPDGQIAYCPRFGRQG
jgi:hypothetical protein